MNHWLAHGLVRLYPPEWTARYGDELEALLEADDETGIRVIVDVIGSAFYTRFVASNGRNVMNAYFTSVLALGKRPSAFLPISMSTTALAMLLVALTMTGLAREADEGALAHVWQILMAGQLPILAFFLVKWLPRAPRAALSMAALQAAAWFAAAAPVYLLGL